VDTTTSVEGGGSGSSTSNPRTPNNRRLGGPAPSSSLLGATTSAVGAACSSSGDASSSDIMSSPDWGHPAYITISVCCLLLMAVGTIWFWQRRTHTPLKQRSPVTVTIIAILMQLFIIFDVIGATTSSYPCYMQVIHESLILFIVCGLYLWRSIDVVFAAALARHLVATAPALPSTITTHTHTHTQTSSGLHVHVHTTNNNNGGPTGPADAVLRASCFVRRRTLKGTPLLACMVAIPCIAALFGVIWATVHDDALMAADKPFCDEYPGALPALQIPMGVFLIGFIVLTSQLRHQVVDTFKLRYELKICSIIMLITLPIGIIISTITPSSWQRDTFPIVPCFQDITACILICFMTYTPIGGSYALQRKQKEGRALRSGPPTSIGHSQPSVIATAAGELATHSHPNHASNGSNGALQNGLLLSAPITASNGAGAMSPKAIRHPRVAGAYALDIRSVMIPPSSTTLQSHRTLNLGPAMMNDSVTTFGSPTATTLMLHSPAANTVLSSPSASMAIGSPSTVSNTPGSNGSVSNGVHGSFSPASPLPVHPRRVTQPATIAPSPTPTASTTPILAPCVVSTTSSATLTASTGPGGGGIEGPATTLSCGSGTVYEPGASPHDLDAILGDPNGIEAFRRYLATEFKVEDLAFIMAVDKWRHDSTVGSENSDVLSTVERGRGAGKIYEQFIAPGSFRVRLTSDQVAHIVDALGPFAARRLTMRRSHSRSSRQPGPIGQGPTGAFVRPVSPPGSPVMPRRQAFIQHSAHGTGSSLASVETHGGGGTGGNGTEGSTLLFEVHHSTYDDARQTVFNQLLHDAFPRFVDSAMHAQYQKARSSSSPGDW
jgi:hypothetical protein